MYGESSLHKSCKEFLQRLGIAIGFDVEVPDIGWHSYSLERVSKGKRPDVIWNFKNAGIPFEGRKNLKLHEPYAILEVESITDWADIKRHLNNINKMGLIPHIVFAVFYDGKIKSTEKEELTEYGRSLGFRLEILYERNLRKKFEKIVDSKTQEEIYEIKEFYVLCDKIKRMIYPNIFGKARDCPNFTIRSSDIFNGDCEAFQRLQLGSKIKVGGTVYRFKLNSHAIELINNLDPLCRGKHTFSRTPFFAYINEILQSDVWEKVKDKGVEDYVKNIIELTLLYVNKIPPGVRLQSVVDTYPVILNMRDIKYAIEISSKLDTWCKIFKSFLKIRARIE
ncbi:hypothetical protein ES703_54159 [subsurface metagenome]